MSRLNDIIEIELNNKKYRARLDFGAIAEAQWNLMKVKKNLTAIEMFDLASKNNYKVISNIIIESIKRCHPQLTEEDILEDMKLREHSNIRNQVIRLFSASLPSADKKKQEE